MDGLVTSDVIQAISATLGIYYPASVNVDIITLFQPRILVSTEWRTFW